MAERIQDVLRYIEFHETEYVTLLQEFCRQPSIAASGEGMAEMAEMVLKRLELLGAGPRRIETGGSPVIYGHIEGKSPRTLGFYNHYDVQPADPLNEWISPPFDANVMDGYLYGRGAVDNKGGLVARIAAVDAWLHVWGELPVSVKFFAEGEEEIGSPHLASFAKENPELIVCDGYMWEGGSKEPDGPPEIALGAKGMLYVELFSGDSADVHSAKAAMLESPVWRLVWALATLKDEKENILIEGFYDGIPELTRAEKEALNADIFDMEKAHNHFGGNRYLPGLTRNELLTRLYYKPTCNICGISAGYQGQGSKTILPGKASAKLDFRLVPGQDPTRIPGLLRTHLDKHGFGDIEVVCLSGCKPYRTDPETPFAKAAVSALEKLYGTKACIRLSEAGTSPMYTFCEGKNIPAAMFGATNKDSSIHSPNEKLGLTNFVQNIKITAMVMEELSKY